MNIRERILKYLEFRNISRYRFYKETGLSNGFLDKEGAINSDNCEKICSCYKDINPEWLVIGKGDMVRYREDDDVERPSIDVLVNKIIELTSENTLLKKENETLKTKSTDSPRIVQHRPFDEDDVKDNVAAEPKP